MLEIISGKKQYNKKEILDIPKLQLGNGIYWLQGANGSGKTTLLRMIAGLIPFRGDILINGISLQRKPLPYRRQVSWAEAEPLYPAFVSGEEMISFYRQVRKASPGQSDKLILLFGMSPYLSAPLGSYSSGMLKRLSLLLAFTGNPALILLDEPLATLDAEAALVLPELIREYELHHGTSVIFSSHQAFDIRSLPVSKKLLLDDQTIHFPA